MNGEFNDHAPGLRFAPDGLDEQTIDSLMAEVAAEAVEVAEPTSAWVDGSAGERRRRRNERRILAAALRSLPSRRHGVEQVPDAA
jgi:hypothetical protein